MFSSRHQNITAEVVPLEIIWQNPLSLVQAHLRVKEVSNPYYQWAEQARKIRARRTNWDTKNSWHESW